MADEKHYTQAEVDALIAENEKGLKANRDEALKEAKRAKDALKGYDGVDPEEFKRLKTAQEEAERKKAAAEGDFKSLEQQLKERHATEIASRETRIKSLSSALEQWLIDAEATREIASRKGSPKVLLPHVKASVRVVEKDGEFVTQVVDSKGNARIGDAQGAPMTIGQLVEEMRGDADFARAFDGTGSSGSGASATQASGGAAGTVSMSDSKAFLANLEGIAKGAVRVAP